MPKLLRLSPSSLIEETVSGVAGDLLVRVSYVPAGHFAMRTCLMSDGRVRLALMSPQSISTGLTCQFVGFID